MWSINVLHWNRKIIILTVLHITGDIEFFVITEYIEGCPTNNFNTSQMHDDLFQ